MEHVCNPWCVGDIHAILFTIVRRGDANDFDRAAGAAEALLSAVGMEAPDGGGGMIPAAWQGPQLGIEGGTIGRFHVFGRRRS
jgi:hypothetical protein